MRRFRFSRGAELCRAALLFAGPLFIGLLLAIPQAIAAEATQVLEVFINGRPSHLLVEFTDRDGGLYAARTDLVQVGLQAPPGPPGELVALRGLAGLRWQVDVKRQEIRFIAADNALQPQLLGEQLAAIGGATASYGAVLNYDVLATDAGATTEATGLFDARVFTPKLNFGTGWTADYTVGDIPGGAEPAPIARLSSSMTYADPDSLRRWRAGDAISGALAWTRPFRLGGFQLASNFALRPDLVTYPVPALAGSAGVPSTVDLLVDGIRQSSQPVQPGPFQLTQVPQITGAGNIAVVVRDPSGQQTVQSLAFYISPELLKPGLASYSVEAGWIRHDYGLPDDGYAEPAESATVRLGLTDWLTGEAHAESTSFVHMGGAGIVVSLFGAALLNLSGAASIASASGSSGRGSATGGSIHGSGYEYTVGLERSGRVFGVFATTTRATRHFLDVSATRNNPVPDEVSRAGFNVTYPSLGALRVAYAAVSGFSPGLLLADGTVLASSYDRTKLVSATYSRPVTERIQFYATAYHEVSGHGSYGVTFGLVIPLGRRTAMSTEAGITDGSPSGTVTASQSANAPGEFGWYASASRYPGQRESGQGTYISRWATVNAAVDHSDGQTGLRGEVNGALVVMPQGVFATDRINDAFAVVDTNGLGGVRVERENQPAGQTDSRGLLLVPGLNAWEPNRLSLNPADLPPDVDTGSLREEVVPRGGAGVHVTFAVTRGQSALVHLVDDAGHDIPPGAAALLLSTNKAVPVGYDGAAYLSGLSAHDELRVRYRTSTCTARFDFAPLPGQIPEIGPVVCHSEASK